MRRARLVAAALAAVVVLGACGDSPEDKAHNDGKKVGEATRAVFDSRSVDDARNAVKELRNTVNGISDDVRKTVRTQVATQGDTLQQAAQGLKQGNLTQVKDSAQEVRAQADAFRHSHDSAANEFWRGFEEGYDG